MSLPDYVKSRNLKPRMLKRAGVCSISAFCFLLSASCFSGVAHADDSSSKKELFLPRKFEAAIKNGETVGWEQVRRVFVTWGTNEFFFVLPQGLRMDANPDKVTLISADSSYFLTLRILSAAAAESNTSNPDACRRHVLECFPAAQILEEFSKTAAGRNGPAFEMRLSVAGGLERALCVALIPSSVGVFEFSLNADLSRSSEAKHAFTSLFRTFRSNESGKLEIPAQVPDNS